MFIAIDYSPMKQNPVDEDQPRLHGGPMYGEIDTPWISQQRQPRTERPDADVQGGPTPNKMEKGQEEEEEKY